MRNRPLTVRYVIFYGLFSPESWQILVGLMAAYFLSPLVINSDGGIPGQVMVFVMIAVIGYAAFRMPALWITKKLIGWFLGKQRP